MSDSAIGSGVITFKTNTIRIPESRVVRLPGRYAHEFASMPIDWRTVTVQAGSKYVDYPYLDPASERAMRRGFADQ